MVTSPTRDEILSLSAGRELDQLVAKYVMDFDENYVDFKPSIDISAAWEVVERLKEHHHFMLSKDVRHKEYRALFEKPRNEPPYEVYDCGCDTVPEAISKAALLAVMGL